MNKYKNKLGFVITILANIAVVFLFTFPLVGCNRVAEYIVAREEQREIEEWNKSVNANEIVFEDEAIEEDEDTEDYAETEEQYIITCSNEKIEEWVRKVVGSYTNITIQRLSTDDIDKADYELTEEDSQKISNSNIFFYVNPSRSIEFEDSNVVSVNLLDFIENTDVEWYEPANAMIGVVYIEKYLCEMDVANAEHYRGNSDSYRATLLNALEH